LLLALFRNHNQEKAGGVPIDENFLEDDWDLDMVED
jgi:hypothetical protein